jgi:hypothetical protein
MQGSRCLVVALPEREQTGLKQGLGTQSIVVLPRHKGTVEPIATFADPVGVLPEVGQGEREAQCVVGPTIVEQPAQCLFAIAIAFVQTFPPLRRLETPEPAPGLFGETQCLRST